MAEDDDNILLTSWEDAQGVIDDARFSLDDLLAFAEDENPEEALNALNELRKELAAVETFLNSQKKPSES